MFARTCLTYRSTMLIYHWPYWMARDDRQKESVLGAAMRGRGRQGRQGRRAGRQPRRANALAGAEANRQAIRRTWIPVGIYVITFSSRAWIYRSSFLPRRLFTSKTARILSLPLSRRGPIFPTSAIVSLLQRHRILPFVRLPPPRHHHCVSTCDME